MTVTVKHIIIVLLLLTLPSCGWYEKLQRGNLYKEQAGLVADHRACLAHNAEHPEKQKDCSVYNQVRYQVDVSNPK